MTSEEEIGFGSFRLLPGRKLLLRGTEEVRIGQRALDLLVTLARHPGQVLDRDALVAAVWPGRHVDESNLRAQVAALRKALGESEAEARHVLTVPGRGYSFVAPLHAPATPVRAAPAADGLPPRLQPVLGRDAEIALLAGHLATRRFVSIIGAGGIGKTTVALSVARRLAAEGDQPPLLLDLGSLTDGALAAGQLLAALGGSLQGGGLAAALGTARRLIILDSCEHVIGAAASLAEQILRAGPEIRLLATSREPLRAEGEWTYRLPSMECPPEGAALTAAQALAYPALALFVERLQAAGAIPELDDAAAALVARICRQLDGIPLAIELAAPRVAQLGLHSLAERLDDRFRLLMQGRRTALPRHQTLRATLDWSHDLLSPEEQRLLRRLAVFQGCFPLDAALAVCGDEGEDPVRLLDRLGSLVDKSFLVPQPRQAEMAYRCLDTTRLYLASKLEEAGETASVALRHARHYAAAFHRAEALWEQLPVAEARARLCPDIDNLRAAIDWSLGTGAQAPLGIALTLSGVPLWSALGMMEEARRRLEAAIAAFRGEVEPEPRLGMRLYAALGTVTVFLSGTLESAWVNALVFAERLGDVEHQLRALNGLALGAMRRDYQEALGHAQRFREIAWRDGQPADGPVGDRLVGFVLHMQGEQAEARRLTEAMLARYPRRTLQPHQNKLNFYDQRILSLATLARIQWLQGEAGPALALAREATAEARQLDHPASIIFAAGIALWPIAYLMGEMEEAAAARQVIQRGLPPLRGWVLWAEAYRGAELIATEQVEAGLPLLRTALDAMSPTSFTIRMPLLHVALAQGVLQQGRPAEALALLDAALAEARRGTELWFEPEYLRWRGEILRALGRPVAEVAAEFEAALAIAARQATPSWSLRAATSLAALRRQGAEGKADRQKLAGFLARFGQGGDTQDLRAAHALLDAAPSGV
ncbi:winged helix-turn-helix domain-containing protein [Pseudoroseomonas cervicalis]|uniref:ATP-binding protein n=1 Tax=Teichococcus cervicalis TaxID=204525 RepID=UPI0022F1A5B3|nr:winged helix-turn-helix domain-containing protein [Pseudoroseomonas cervicalis]WBV41562.1 winged helix-turn-helix domain-containing protein [Pseudoroseomonas cervicalis]